MSMLSRELKGIERKISSAIPHAHSADTRANMYAAREQMQFYREQKDEYNKQAAKLSDQKAVETKKLHEKQIRTLRSHYKKRSGLMSSSTGDTPNETLG